MPNIVVREEELRWFGEWDSATTYPVEAVVSRSGSSYVASAVTQAQDPLNGAPWALVASKGDQGVQGPVGPAGGEESRYVHTQAFSSSVWNIPHNLSRYPSVTVVDSAGTVVFGSVAYVDVNTIEITFSASFQGKAFLN